MCVVCTLCVSVLLHNRTSALSHLAGTALPTPARSHTGSHWSTAPCVLLLQCTASLPGGSGQWNSCNALPLCPGGSGQWNSCYTLPHCLGAVGSGTPATHCLTALGQWAVQILQYTAALPWGQWAVELLQCTAPLLGGSGQRNSCNTVPHCLAAVGSRTPAMHCLTAPGAVGSGPPAMLCTPAGGVRGVLPWGWSDYRRAGGREGWKGSRACFRAGGGEGGRGILQQARHPAPSRAPRTRQGSFSGRASSLALAGDVQSVLCCAVCCAVCFAVLGATIFQEPGAPAWGERGVRPRGWSEYPAGPMGRRLLRRTGHTSLGGTGGPAQGVVGASSEAHGEPSSSLNRAHRPGGDGESSPGGGRSILQGPWGGVFFGEPGTPAWGGRGVQPRGWSEPPSRPMGSHHLPRTGRTGLGGTGSPAQGVVGKSFKAHGEASSSENRAHRPGGDGGSSPGGGRSLLQGSRGAIFFREPSAPAWGGRGVQPRGW